MEIAKNIKIIDNLQCQLLSLVSQLFLSMQNSDMTTAERAEILANIEVILYLLSEKLGVPCKTLDQKAIARIKIGILKEESNEEWKNSLLGILHYLDNRTKK